MTVKTQTSTGASLSSPPLGQLSQTSEKCNKATGKFGRNVSHVHSRNLESLLCLSPSVCTEICPDLSRLWALNGVLTGLGLTRASLLAGQRFMDTSTYTRLQSPYTHTYTHTLPIRQMLDSRTVGIMIITI